MPGVIGVMTAYVRPIGRGIHHRVVGTVDPTKPVVLKPKPLVLGLRVLKLVVQLAEPVLELGEVASDLLRVETPQHLAEGVCLPDPGGWRGTATAVHVAAIVSHDAARSSVRAHTSIRQSGSLPSH
jgi:hypothetical protein